jgi:hypothetical protein
MDWFERLAGFRETNCADTRASLTVDCDKLQSVVNRKRCVAGTLELASLAELWERARPAGSLPGKLKVSIATGDIRQMHQLPVYPAGGACRHAGGAKPVRGAIAALVGA